MVIPYIILDTFEVVPLKIFMFVHQIYILKARCLKIDYNNFLKLSLYEKFIILCIIMFKNG